MTAFNGIGWFEIGTDRPEAAERFYGDVFGWTFGDDSSGAGYRMVTTPGADRPGGGIFPTGGTTPNYAVFYVVVEDAAATCAQAERAGGKVLAGPQRAPSGLTFAHLLDPSGNHFGVFTPPAS